MFQNKTLGGISGDQPHLSGGLSDLVAHVGIAVIGLCFLIKNVLQLAFNGFMQFSMHYLQLFPDQPSFLRKTIIVLLSLSTFLTVNLRKNAFYQLLIQIFRQNREMCSKAVFLIKGSLQWFSNMFQ